MVMDLFKPSHKFEYDPDNHETRDDIHHFYGTYRMYVMEVAELTAAGNPNATIPIQFRNLPTNLGHMQRQIHNTFHLKTNLVPMPELDPMVEYARNFRIGKQILNKMIKAAEETIEWSERRISRRNNILQKPEIINFSDIDTYGERILNDMHNRHFGSMVNAINELRAHDSNNVVVLHDALRTEQPDPHHVLRIGKTASRSAINYAPQIRAS
jgi:hypothetical protein